MGLRKGSDSGKGSGSRPSGSSSGSGSGSKPSRSGGGQTAPEGGIITRPKSGADGGVMGRQAPESYPEGGGKRGKRDGCGTSVLLLVLAVFGALLLLAR